MQNEKHLSNSEAMYYSMLHHILAIHFVRVFHIQILHLLMKYFLISNCQYQNLLHKNTSFALQAYYSFSTKKVVSLPTASFHTFYGQDNLYVDYFYLSVM